MNPRQLSILGAKAVAVRAFLKGAACAPKVPPKEYAGQGARERARRVRQEERRTQDTTPSQAPPPQTTDTETENENNG